MGYNYTLELYNLINNEIFMRQFKSGNTIYIAYDDLSDIIRNIVYESNNGFNNALAFDILRYAAENNDTILHNNIMISASRIDDLKKHMAIVEHDMNKTK